MTPHRKNMRRAYWIAIGRPAEADLMTCSWSREFDTSTSWTLDLLNSYNYGPRGRRRSASWSLGRLLSMRGPATRGAG